MNSDSPKPYVGSNILVWTYEEGKSGLDTLLHALRYLADQYSDKMTRDEAVVHFESRHLLMRKYYQLLNEMEDAFLRGGAFKSEANA